MSNQKRRVIALIQARMGSTRLPGKVLIDICGRPVIWHIWNRLKSVPEIDDVVVATSVDERNDILEQFCISANISCFRGSEDEVLDRFYKAAKQYHANIIVRVTGDCPLLDPNSISIAIQRFLQLGLDIDHVGLAAGAGVFNQKVNKFPDGTDAEVVAFKALERAWIDAIEKKDRGESVTSYIWRNKDKFRCDTIYCREDLGHLRWTLDRQEDLEFVRRVYKELYREGSCFSMMDILALLEVHPELAEINQQWVSKEDYETYYITDNHKKEDLR